MQVEEKTPITQIATGSNHSLLLTENGDTFIWGQNDRGQIPECSSSFVELPIRTSIRNGISIACYGNASCVLTKTDVYYWSYYRENTLVTHPTRVNTLCYLSLQIVQIGCHDGFNTIVTEQGQLFGYYYYIDKNKVMSASASRLFPSSVLPGCIHPLLPSCVRP